ncbi:cytochrome c oxidase subunit II [Arthrobacter sp. H14-L1]|uniref:aa3-type cytochrome oxidase subunit II n=1 Tax=Arthrobacter sp. H14-L1 TaxID=2996697 RepID=UPI00226D4BCF|nr:cytochrome c oxidase subunit II [Arthrobacter sp. H14-L1]MCY0903716.1 cytochrome c oxidase subunit II [Arthrobacter sp. H14-L1]
MSSQDRTGSRRAKFIPITGLLIVGALALSGCTPESKNGWLPSERNVTNHTGQVIDLWVNSWITVMIVGVITWGLMIWCIIAYRRRKNAVGFPRQISYNLPLEIFYVVIPLFMVMVFFYFTDASQKSLDARDPAPAVTIDVRGKQWSWDFNYVSKPDIAGNVIADSVYEGGTQIHLDGTPVDQNTLPTLYLPVNKSVELQLNSRDVIHSFWVPAFLRKLDIIPGKTNYLTLTPTAIGTYDGKCAELCGEYHSEMLFRVKVVSEQDFQQHLASLKAAGYTGSLDSKYDRNPNLNAK